MSAVFFTNILIVVSVIQMLSILVDFGSFVFTDDSKVEVFNSYFNSVNVDDDGTLLDFPHRVKANVSLDAVECGVCSRENIIIRL